jgi:hypothetical protein
VGACIRAGLVGGKGFAVDASLIVADANKQRSTPGAVSRSGAQHMDSARATSARVSHKKADEWPSPHIAAGRPVS